MLVIKIGGTNGVNIEAVIADIASQVKAGQKLIVVHGGSGETNAISEQLGHPPRFPVHTNRASKSLPFRSQVHTPASRM